MSSDEEYIPDEISDSEDISLEDEDFYQDGSAGVEDVDIQQQHEDRINKVKKELRALLDNRDIDNFYELLEKYFKLTIEEMYLDLYTANTVLYENVDTDIDNIYQFFLKEHLLEFKNVGAGTAGLILFEDSEKLNIPKDKDRKKYLIGQFTNAILKSFEKYVRTIEDIKKEDILEEDVLATKEKQAKEKKVDVTKLAIYKKIFGKLLSIKDPVPDVQNVELDISELLSFAKQIKKAANNQEFLSIYNEILTRKLIIANDDQNEYIKYFNVDEITKDLDTSNPSVIESHFRNATKDITINRYNATDDIRINHLVVIFKSLYKKKSDEFLEEFFDQNWKQIIQQFPWNYEFRTLVVPVKSVQVPDGLDLDKYSVEEIERWNKEQLTEKGQGYSKIQLIKWKTTIYDRKNNLKELIKAHAGKNLMLEDPFEYTDMLFANSSLVCKYSKQFEGDEVDIDGKKYTISANPTMTLVGSRVTLKSPRDLAISNILLYKNLEHLKYVTFKKTDENRKELEDQIKEFINSSDKSDLTDDSYIVTKDLGDQIEIAVGDSRVIINRTTVKSIAYDKYADRIKLTYGKLITSNHEQFKNLVKWANEPANGSRVVDYVNLFRMTCEKLIQKNGLKDTEFKYYPLKYEHAFMKKFAKFLNINIKDEYTKDISLNFYDNLFNEILQAWNASNDPLKKYFDEFNLMTIQKQVFRIDMPIEQMYDLVKSFLKTQLEIPSKSDLAFLFVKSIDEDPTLMNSAEIDNLFMYGYKYHTVLDSDSAISLDSCISDLYKKYHEEMKTKIIHKDDIEHIPNGHYFTYQGLIYKKKYNEDMKTFSIIPVKDTDFDTLESIEQYLTTGKWATKMAGPNTTVCRAWTSTIVIKDDSYDDSYDDDGNRTKVVPVVFTDFNEYLKCQVSVLYRNFKHYENKNTETFRQFKLDTEFMTILVRKIENIASYLKDEKENIEDIEILITKLKKKLSLYKLSFSLEVLKHRLSARNVILKTLNDIKNTVENVEISNKIENVVYGLFGEISSTSSKSQSTKSQLRKKSKKRTIDRKVFISENYNNKIKQICLFIKDDDIVIDGNIDVGLLIKTYSSDFYKKLKNVNPGSIGPANDIENWKPKSDILNKFIDLLQIYSNKQAVHKEIIMTNDIKEFKHLKVLDNLRYKTGSFKTDLQKYTEMVSTLSVDSFYKFIDTLQYVNLTYLDKKELFKQIIDNIKWTKVLQTNDKSKMQRVRNRIEFPINSPIVNNTSRSKNISEILRYIAQYVELHYVLQTVLDAKNTEDLLSLNTTKPTESRELNFETKMNNISEISKVKCIRDGVELLENLCYNCSDDINQYNALVSSVLKTDVIALLNIIKSNDVTQITSNFAEFYPKYLNSKFCEESFELNQNIKNTTINAKIHNVLSKCSAKLLILIQDTAEQIMSQNAKNSYETKIHKQIDVPILNMINYEVLDRKDYKKENVYVRPMTRVKFTPEIIITRIRNNDTEGSSFEKSYPIKHKVGDKFVFNPVNEPGTMLKVVHYDKKMQYPVPMGYVDGKPCFSKSMKYAIAAHIREGTMSPWLSSRYDQLSQEQLPFVFSDEPAVSNSKYYIKLIFSDPEYNRYYEMKVGVSKYVRFNNFSIVKQPYDIFEKNRVFSIIKNVGLGKRLYQLEEEKDHFMLNLGEGALLAGPPVRVEVGISAKIVPNASMGAYSLINDMDLTVEVKGKFKEGGEDIDVFSWNPPLSQDKPFWSSEIAKYKNEIKRLLGLYGAQSSIFINYKNEAIKQLQQLRNEIVSKTLREQETKQPLSKSEKQDLKKNKQDLKTSKEIQEIIKALGKTKDADKIKELQERIAKIDSEKQLELDAYSRKLAEESRNELSKDSKDTKDFVNAFIKLGLLIIPDYLMNMISETDTIFKHYCRYKKVKEQVQSDTGITTTIHDVKTTSVDIGAILINMNSYDHLKDVLNEYYNINDSNIKWFNSKEKIKIKGTTTELRGKSRARELPKPIRQGAKQLTMTLQNYLDYLGDSFQQYKTYEKANGFKRIGAGKDTVKTNLFDYAAKYITYNDKWVDSIDKSKFVVKYENRPKNLYSINLVNENLDSDKGITDKMARRFAFMHEVDLNEVPPFYSKGLDEFRESPAINLEDVKTYLEYPSGYSKNSNKKQVKSDALIKARHSIFVRNLLAGLVKAFEIKDAAVAKIIDTTSDSKIIDTLQTFVNEEFSEVLDFVKTI